MVEKLAFFYKEAGKPIGKCLGAWVPGCLVPIVRKVISVFLIPSEAEMIRPRDRVGQQRGSSWGAHAVVSQTVAKLCFVHSLRP